MRAPLGMKILKNCSCLGRTITLTQRNVGKGVKEQARSGYGERETMVKDEKGRFALSLADKVPDY